MENTSKLAVLGTVLLVVSGGLARADGNFYVTADGGGAFQDSMGIRSGSINSTAGDLHFNNGFRAGMEFGYRFNDYLSAELESGFLRNGIDQIGIQRLSDVGGSADLEQVPLLVNGILTIPIKGPVKPYIGAGVGAVAGIFNSSSIPGSYSLGEKPQYDDTDFTFAYQAEVGIKWAVFRHVDIGLSYKFLGTTENAWHDNNITMKTVGSKTHAVEAALTWKF